MWVDWEGAAVNRHESGGPSAQLGYLRAAMGRAVCPGLGLVAVLLLAGPGYADPPAQGGKAGQAGQSDEANPNAPDAGSVGATPDRQLQSEQQQVGESDAGPAQPRRRIALARGHFDAALKHYRRGKRANLTDI